MPETSISIVMESEADIIEAKVPGFESFLPCPT